MALTLEQDMSGIDCDFFPPSGLRQGKNNKARVIKELQEQLVPNMKYTYARVKINRIIDNGFASFDENIPYMEEYILLISKIKKKEEVSQDEIDDWAKLAETCEERASLLLRDGNRIYDDIDKNYIPFDPALKTIVLDCIKNSYKKRSDMIWDFAVFLKASVAQLSSKNKNVKIKTLSSTEDWDNYWEEIAS
ncbi:hypothetical protein [Candidatus Liberibacter brunswickensis]|uniref:hypothetical protein n=1 Tax=Candidatus Liberibacter brunswickensis TaxID=1968796 RepID=UPI002FE1294E